MRYFGIGVVAGSWRSSSWSWRGTCSCASPPSQLIQDSLVLRAPGQVFAFMLDRMLYLGKPTFFASLLLLQLLLAGSAGLVLARWPRPWRWR